MRLTDAQHVALYLLRRAADPWAVVYAGENTMFDGQAWLNHRTVEALERKGLVVSRDRDDREAWNVRLAGESPGTKE